MINEANRSVDSETPIVIALGGNAISKKGEEGNIDQQFVNSAETSEHLANLISQGHRLVVTHGNGPQVGSILRRMEISQGDVYSLPLHICVADTQAGMGHMISQCLNNALGGRGIKKIASTIITHVLVDPEDDAFDNPTKPIGKFMDAAESEALAKRYDWEMGEYGEGEFRRVVASPQPTGILEIEMIKTLVQNDQLLVVGGGGGIPVSYDADHKLFGVDCVVDKDLTSALLAVALGAQTLIIATAVEKVVLGFGSDNEQPLDSLTVSEAQGYMASGEFPAGTMGPKVQAGLNFLKFSKHNDPQVIITDLEYISEALQGKTGTRIVRG